MRVLFIVTPVASHLAPLVPLAWALRGAGHEVLVAGQPDVLSTAGAAGLNAVGVGDWFRVEDRIASQLPFGWRPNETWGQAVDDTQRGAFADSWTIHNEAVLQSYLSLARAFRPDLIVSDILEFCSLIIGGLLQVPVVQHRWGVDPLSGPTRLRAGVGHQELCESLGLPRLPDPTVVLDPCPPSLQLPEVAPGRPIRHVHAHGNGRLPPWIQKEWAAGVVAESPSRSRRVVVSLGRSTLALNGVPLMRGILRAFASLPQINAVATVPVEFREGLGPVPANVRLVEPLPLHLVLDTSDAVLHHGGAGTTMTATRFGLPQLVVPQLADQFAHAAQIAGVGAGIMVDKPDAQNDSARIGRELAALLDGSGYPKAARELRCEMAQMPTPSQVVVDLEQLV